MKKILKKSELKYILGGEENNFVGPVPHPIPPVLNSNLADPKKP